MSLHTNCHAPRINLSGRFQIGHKSGLFIYLSLLFIYCEYKASQASHLFRPLLVFLIFSRELTVIKCTIAIA